MVMHKIDTNVYLDRWPFRRLPADTLPELLALLDLNTVFQAWVGSFDGLLHKDIAAVNQRLADACQEHANVLRPFGTVNPTLPQWEDDLVRCAERHHMPGIRLHPNYHGYTLDDPRFLRLLHDAAERGLVIQLVVTMEDERMMHPLMRVEHVDVTPLPGLVQDIPNLRLILLNAFRAVRGDLITRLAETERIWFDIAWLEGAEGIATLAKQVPYDRIVFGSYSPMFYFESSWLKLQESPISEDERHMIQLGNAEALIRST